MHVDAPLNGMDRALVTQTYPGRPMTTHHVVETARPFERARLVSAAASTAAGEPLLRSFVREAPFDITRFALAELSTSAESWLEFRSDLVDLDDTGWVDRPFDLAREAPFRLLHTPRREGGYRLVFSLHHSVTDGIGAMALFDRLLRAYESTAACATPDEAELPGGGLGRLLASRGLRWSARAVVRSVLNAAHFGARRAMLLEEPDAPALRTGTLVVDVPRALWDALGASASGAGVSRNDLLLTAFFRAASAWVRARGRGGDDLRALIPADLRDALGVSAQAMQNHLGVIICDVRESEVDDPSLPRLVRARVQAARSTERLVETPLVLSMLGALLPPPLMREVFRRVDGRRGASMYTALFSHVRPREGPHLPASLGPERVWCCSTLPRQPGVGFTVTTTALGTTVALSWQEPRLSREGARELTRRFVEALSALAEADADGAAATVSR